MKFKGLERRRAAEKVAPLVGAWIEIDHKGYYCSTCAVAPLVGAWIEIEQLIEDYERARESLPSWERGLKFFLVYPLHPWVRRSPRGSVD